MSKVGKGFWIKLSQNSSFCLFVCFIRNKILGIKTLAQFSITTNKAQKDLQCFLKPTFIFSSPFYDYLVHSLCEIKDQENGKIQECLSFQTYVWSEQDHDWKFNLYIDSFPGLYFGRSGDGQHSLLFLFLIFFFFVFNHFIPESTVHTTIKQCLESWLVGISYAHKSIIICIAVRCKFHTKGPGFKKQAIQLDLKKGTMRKRIDHNWVLTWVVYFPFQHLFTFKKNMCSRSTSS